jgi:hypothetical protein
MDIYHWPEVTYLDEAEIDTIYLSLRDYPNDRVAVPASDDDPDGFAQMALAERLARELGEGWEVRGHNGGSGSLWVVNPRYVDEDDLAGTWTM